MFPFDLSKIFVIPEYESLAVKKFFKGRACHLEQAPQISRDLEKELIRSRKQPKYKDWFVFHQVMDGVGHYMLVAKSLCWLTLELANTFSHQHI